MKIWKCLSLSLLLVLGAAPVDARPRGIGAVAGGAPSAGKTIINLGSEFRYGQYANIMKAYGSHGFTGDATPANLDDNLMPSGSWATGTISGPLYFPSAFFTSVTQVAFRASPGCVTKIVISQNTNLVSTTATGVTTSGGSASPLTVTFDGTGFAGGDARVVFTFPSYSAQFINVAFQPAFTHNCPSTTAASGLKMVRVSDEALFDANPYALTPEAKAAFQTLNLGAIRWMGQQNSNGGNLSRWNMRIKPSTLGWGVNFSNYRPGSWAGVTTGTDTYTVANAPNSPGGAFVDGEVVQATFVNAANRIDISNAVAANGSNCAWATAGRVCLTVNSMGTVVNGQQVWIGGIAGTTEANGIHTAQTDGGDATHIALSDVVFVNAFNAGGSFAHVTNQTINVGARGVKRLCQIYGDPLWSSSSTQAPQANQAATLVFDTLLDCWKWNAGGAVPDMPWEAMAAVSNELGIDLYAQIAAYADDDYATNAATVVRDNLRSGLVFHVSWSNEIWNLGFSQGAWAERRGQALGLVHGRFSYYSLRIHSIFASVIPTVFAGQMDRVLRVVEGQGSSTTNMSTYELASAELAPSGVSTGTGNSTYCTWTGGTFSGSCTGGANYTAYPNRTRDFADAAAYAPYAGGTAYCFGTDMSACSTSNPGVPAVLQSVINAYEAGSTATVISLIDEDIRHGRTLVQNITAAGTVFTTSLSHTFSSGNQIICLAAGGTLYSGMISGQMYQISPNNLTATTFSLRQYNNANVVVATDINAGSAGTGTTSCGLVPNFRNLQQASVTWHLPWETMTATFDSPVCSTSKAACGAQAFGPLQLLQYEGNLEPDSPSPAQCVTMGLTTVPPDGTGAACATKLDAALTVWKNSNEAAITTRLYYAQFNGTDPNMVPTFGVMAHARRPAWLQMLGPGTEWTMSPASNYVDGYAQRYKTWDGFGSYAGVP